MKLEEKHQAMEEEKIQLEATLKVIRPDAIFRNAFDSTMEDAFGCMLNNFQNHS
jgi:tellurite resistance-related uncharacterized protein